MTALSGMAASAAVRQARTVRPMRATVSHPVQLTPAYFRHHSRSRTGLRLADSDRVPLSRLPPVQCERRRGCRHSAALLNCAVMCCSRVERGQRCSCACPCTIVIVEAVSYCPHTECCHHRGAASGAQQSPSRRRRVCSPANSRSRSSREARPQPDARTRHASRSTAHCAASPLRLSHSLIHTPSRCHSSSAHSPKLLSFQHCVASCSNSVPLAHSSPFTRQPLPSSIQPACFAPHVGCRRRAVRVVSTRAAAPAPPASACTTLMGDATLFKYGYQINANKHDSS